MLKRVFWLLPAAATIILAADLPVREVILYKHGVGYFERSGELKAGETARLVFKASPTGTAARSEASATTPANPWKSAWKTSRSLSEMNRRWQLFWTT
jgi:hypothetical protein